jgi:hypothetical protein
LPSFEFIDSERRKIVVRGGYGSAHKTQKRKDGYFSGTYIEDRDAPMPGVPCLTGLFVIANSPK